MTNNTGIKDIIYIGIALAGLLVVKTLKSPSQSGYQQISLSTWSPMSKEEIMRLGI